MHTLTFLPMQKTIKVPAGTDLLQGAALAGIPVEGNCGGKGTCGKCKVKIVEGMSQAPSALEARFLSAEELSAGVVLACQREATGDLVVEVAVQNDELWRKTALRSQTEEVSLEPSVSKYYLKLPRPSIDDQTPDFERLLAQLPQQDYHVDLHLLARLPQILRQEKFAVTAVTAENKIIAVEPGDTRRHLYGLAVDLGTTTIAVSLLDLENGQVLAAAAVTNPQKVFGADVISRITNAGKKGAIALQEKAVAGVNQAVAELVSRSGIDPMQIYEVVAVGNTTMSHLFLGIDPTYLAPAPFIPAYRSPMETAARGLGLAINPAARVTVLPNLAGYVGSDTVGVILAGDLDRLPGPCLAIDIGTNGEIVLAAGGRLLTCSTAAGPAFEGAQIKQGMRAAEGAIEAVTIDDDLHLKVIGGGAPRGICGSGLIDAAAELFRAGAVETTGRFVDPATADLPLRIKERLRPAKGGRMFVLSPGEDSATGEDIVLTQSDLREMQLAKGAIYAGCKVLLSEAGVAEEDLKTVMLAGAFGNYIRKESALALGLLPRLPLERIISIGNAAGAGASMALISKTVRERSFNLPVKVEHVELSTRADFQQEFINALGFSK